MKSVRLVTPEAALPDKNFSSKLLSYRIFGLRMRLRAQGASLPVLYRKEGELHVASSKGRLRDHKRREGEYLGYYKRADSQKARAIITVSEHAKEYLSHGKKCCFCSAECKSLRGLKYHMIRKHLAQSGAPKKPRQNKKGRVNSTKTVTPKKAKRVVSRNTAKKGSSMNAKRKASDSANVAESSDSDPLPLTRVSTQDSDNERRTPTSEESGSDDMHYEVLHKAVQLEKRLKKLRNKARQNGTLHRYGYIVVANCVLYRYFSSRQIITRETKKDDGQAQQGHIWIRILYLYIYIYIYGLKKFHWTTDRIGLLGLTA
jgi:hypothetical protein